MKQEDLDSQIAPLVKERMADCAPPGTEELWERFKATRLAGRRRMRRAGRPLLALLAAGAAALLVLIFISFSGPPKQLQTVAERAEAPKPISTGEKNKALLAGKREGSSPLLSNQSLAKAPEKEAVQAAIERGRPLDFLVRHKGELGRDALVGVASPAELTAGEPFKVFVSNAAVVQALIKNKPVIPLIERCRYYWEVPVFAQTGTPVASFRVENFQGEWQVVEVGGSFRETELKLLAHPEQIEALLREHGIKQADAYAHFALPPLHTDFLVFAAGGEEYFIPLLHGGVRKAWGLKSGKLYPRSAVAGTVGPVLKRMRARPDRETGTPTVARQHSPRPAWPAYTAGALLVVIAGSVFWVRRTRRK